MTSLAPVAQSADRVPHYQRLRAELSAKIASQFWKPGDAIATESELASTYGVSVGTVRKAIDSLVADRILERAQGKGTFVCRPKFDSSLFRFFRFEGLDGEQLTPESRILKRELIKAPPLVAQALGLGAAAHAIHLHRLRLVEGRPFMLESIWLSRVRFAALLKIDPREFGDLLYPLYEQYCGQVVATARETLTAEAAGSRQAKLLGIPAGSPVVVIERLARSFDHSPIEWRRTYGASNQFRYHIEIR